MGFVVGILLGNSVDLPEGIYDGFSVGSPVGKYEDSVVGILVGFMLGQNNGDLVGFTVGLAVGNFDETIEGRVVGQPVLGHNVGSTLGTVEGI